ncbi:hypothetical protein GCM10027261_23500 [Geodermatophilus arenarius]
MTARSRTIRSSSGCTATAYAGTPDDAVAFPGDACAGAGATTSSAAAVAAIEAVSEPADRGRRDPHERSAAVMVDLPRGAGPGA